MGELVGKGHERGSCYKISSEGPQRERSKEVNDY